MNSTQDSFSVLPFVLYFIMNQALWVIVCPLWENAYIPVNLVM